MIDESELAHDDCRHGRYEALLPLRHFQVLGLHPAQVLDLGFILQVALVSHSLKVPQILM